MRILGIDWGDRKVGLAVSDSLQLTAQPLGTYRIKALAEENRKYFRKIVTDFEIERVVIGNPLRMDGSSGTRTQKTREFALWLEKEIGVEVVLWDERLTSHQAQNILRAQNAKCKGRNDLEDQLSAVIILAAYLESRRMKPDVPESR